MHNYYVHVTCNVHVRSTTQYMYRYLLVHVLSAKVHVHVCIYMYMYIYVLHVGMYRVGCYVAVYSTYKLHTKFERTLLYGS